MVGGPLKLDGAVARGACKKSVDDQGIEMFMFPKNAVGERQSAKDITRAERGKKMDTKSYKAIGAALDEMGWAFASNDPAIRKSLAIKDKLPKEMEAKLISNHREFKKCYDQCERSVSKLTSKWYHKNMDESCQRVIIFYIRII